ncbi:uncharacterized protein LOC117183109 isoform X2 [Belonocnema kinseyi]|uniref:uncharacterized protein LOC117183109 isoform X2 n=1 Tax=Belonocnema kinseyi TaxID=2817044 RepID=UPI00143E0097|nr:uncharacterized protein LOC117183109 isoform X2 [Belonocnema kinseyi]
MKRLLYLMAIAICEGARIPRGINHHFPHFKAIYHGHGATSYQNVEIQNHGSVPIPNNYVERIADHQSFDYSNHGSISIANNNVQHIHEQHPSQYLTHVSIPTENNYVEHDEHYPSDDVHIQGLHEVQGIIEVPAEHHSVENYVISTLTPYIANDYQYLELETRDAHQYYLHNHQHDYEYH